AETFGCSNGLRCFWRNFLVYRQFQSECRAAPIRAPGVQFTSVLFHNLGTNAETEANAALPLFSSKEWIEYTSHVAGMDTAAVAGNGKMNTPILDKRFQVNSAGPQGGIGDRVFGIDDQVQNNLFQPVRITPGIWQILRKIHADNDVFNVRLIFSQL